MKPTGEITNLLESLPQLNSNQIEAVEEGKKVTSNSNIINSPVMQFLMLAAQTSQLTKIRKTLEHVGEYLDDRTSEGWIQNFDNIPVTDADPSREIRIDFSAQSISITNDGPALVWIEINKRFHTRRTLNPFEVLNINFETHKLEKFFVQCPPGLVSSIRATARG